MKHLEGLALILQVSLMFGILLLAVSVLYLLNYAFFFVKGIVFRRRSCRIPAVLSGGSQKFHGHLSVIGIDGVNFCPENQTTAGQLKDLLSSDDFVEFDLHIEDRSIPVFVDGFHILYSPLYFLEQLTEDVFSKILLLSTKSPEIVANIPHKTTKRKWRENIEVRKARISDLRKPRKDPVI